MQPHLEPELWVENTAVAIDFYERAFGAAVEHRVGGPRDPDGVAALSIAGARFWVSASSEAMGRFSASAIGGATRRTLLVLEDPRAATERFRAAGGTLLSEVGLEHGWLLGRVRDPFGHEWEIGRPLDAWPPPG